MVAVADETTGEQLTDHLRSTIASFAVPTRWRIEHNPLPTNHAGKIDKTAIAAAARAALVAAEGASAGSTGRHTGCSPRSPQARRAE